ncbi:MAG: hypothetical protein IT534_09090 [Bauldia sp.]|nr:hypothetical protein [Bauldia sp.]
MSRADDAERLKVLSARIAVLRQELAEMRAERDAVVSRLRALPGGTDGGSRIAVKVSYGEDGEGLFLADIPKARPAAAPRPAPGASAVDPDVEDR